MIRLSDYQSARDRWYFWVDRDDLRMIPAALHVTDAQTGEYLVEIERTLENQVALRLCGVTGLFVNSG